jgi:DNA-binding NarL/FixJ family response regulator
MPLIAALVSDLLFGSKVAATARAHGIEFRGVRSASAIASADLQPDLLFIDLEAEIPEGDPCAAIAAALAKTPRPKVVAFAGHLLVDRLEAAQRAGADLVLSRGGFSQRLEGLVRELAGER